MSVNIVNLDGSLLRVAGGILYADAPIGEIHAFGGSVVPSGYLLCNGQAVSRTNYAELFAVIGTAFGSGDGSTTFNVPDLRETAPVGVGTRDIGVADHDTYTLGQFKDDQLQEHGHTIIFQDNANINGGGRARALRNETPYNSSSNTLVTDVQNARTGTTTHGKQLGVNYIIKAKQVAVPADFKDAIDNVLKVSEPVSVTNTEYTTNGSIVWKRSGNVVEVTFLDVAFTSQTGGDVTLATGLPPSKNYSWSVIRSLIDVNVQQGVAVDTNGNLTSIGGSTGGSSYYDSFTYLAAD